ncbi:uncharacterized protein [Pagrus major]|uniref:uncharacterized protein isoform X2 n=1 Tax=Pagrus major TaxID=143350 RepID=UPI003CC8A80C
MLLALQINHTVQVSHLGLYMCRSLTLLCFLASSVFISARPMSNNSVNNKNISIGCDEGNIGAENEYNVKGDKGENVTLGEISNIHVSKTNRGCIGGKNNYNVTAQIAAKSNIGHVSNVTVGSNSGSIGSGNRININ